LNPPVGEFSVTKPSGSLKVALTFCDAFPDKENGERGGNCFPGFTRILAAKIGRAAEIVPPRKRSAMSATAMRILVIGKVLPSTRDILRRLGDQGWGARCVPSVHEAKEAMAIFDFDVTLAAESLPDGRGYDVAELIAEHARSLFVSVVLSESCLWLPVVFRGAHVLGQRALKPQMLEPELETLLSVNARESARDSVRHVVSNVVREISRRPQAAEAHPGPERPQFLRRKYRDRDIALMER
jgi:hypothetical protein